MSLHSWFGHLTLGVLCLLPVVESLYPLTSYPYYPFWLLCPRQPPPSLPATPSVVYQASSTLRAIAFRTIG
jgi:hypothetical protein